MSSNSAILDVACLATSVAKFAGSTPEPAHQSRQDQKQHDESLQRRSLLCVTLATNLRKGPFGAVQISFAPLSTTSMLSSP